MLSRSHQRWLLPAFEALNTTPLKSAVAGGLVGLDTHLFVSQLDEQRVMTLVARQMGVHPVAQGEFDGRPWLVTF